MDDIAEGLIKGILRFCGVIARSVVWLILTSWEYCFEIVGWYIGWPICRCVTFGHLPKEGITQHESAKNSTVFFVSFIGFTIPVVIAVLLAPWEKLGG